MIPEQVAAEMWNLDPHTLHATRIKNGLTNESYRIDGGPERIVVRISTADDNALQINRTSESIVLNLVAAVGIGVPILLCQPQFHILITREISGHNPDKYEVGDIFNLLRIAKLLHELHEMNVTQTVQQIHLVKILRGYWQLLGEPENEQAMIIAQESDAQSQRCLCHNDVHYLNLIDDGTRLWLLDWEYAGIGDPYFDLASVCCYHDFDAEQRSMFLGCYASNATQLDLARLNRMCWLFNYIKELWFAARNLSGINQ